MKKFTIHTRVENKSRYPIELVWENAQDLEHVGYLHARTNSGFRLLFHESLPNSPYVYDRLIYEGKRKIRGLFSIASFGFRKIIAANNLHQFEVIPALGWTSFLNSQLLETGDKEFPTMMRDDLIIELPVIFKPLRGWIEKSVVRHARFQCEEDEPFRARRQLLHDKGIRLPLKIFNESEFTKFSRHFSNPPQLSTALKERGL